MQPSSVLAPGATPARADAARRVEPARWVEPANVLTLAQRELADALRNRWFALHTAGLAALALAISGLAASQQGAFGLTGLGRTSASLVNLVMLVVPLMGLTLGALSLAGERERGTLLYLLAQPVTHAEVFLGKYLGLAAALLASLLLGFGLSGGVVAAFAGGAQAGGYLTLVALAFALGLATLGLGLCLSAVARRASTAIGAAVFVWLALALLGDLGLMGTALAVRLSPGTLLGLALVNPLHVFKVAALASAGPDALEVLGPAGLYALRTFDARLVPLLLGLLAAWVVLPAAAGYALFRWKGAL